MPFFFHVFRQYLTKGKFAAAHFSSSSPLNSPSQTPKWPESFLSINTILPGVASAECMLNAVIFGAEKGPKGGVIFVGAPSEPMCFLLFFMFIKSGVIIFGRSKWSAKGVVFYLGGFTIMYPSLAQRGRTVF